MKQNIYNSLRAVMLLVITTFCMNLAQAADKEITPEFAEEGIQKAEKAMANMVTKINDLERAEDAVELEHIMNSIEFRNVRKKYGKVELTTEFRERLVTANVAVAKALMDYLDRVSVPYEVRQQMEAMMSTENITNEIAKATTLREALE
jgi:hypothetical protein